MSDSAIDSISLKDQRLIVSLYHLRSLAAVAEELNISKSAVAKRLEKIQEKQGELFKLGRKTVSLYPHTRDVVEELEKSLEYASKAWTITSKGSTTGTRRRVDVAIIDQLESPVASALARHLPESHNIQIQFHHTAPNILENRLQNLFETSTRLENGDVDLAIFYEYNRAKVKGGNSKFPKFGGMRAIELETDETACLVNKDIDIEGVMSLKQFYSFGRIAQIPTSAYRGADIQWIVSNLSTAAELIANDKNLICTPPSLVARHYASRYGLKVLPIPPEEKVSLTIKMAFSDATEQDDPCLAVRSAIIKAFMYDLSV